MKTFIVKSKDLLNKKKNPNFSLSVKDILKNKKIKKYNLRKNTLFEIDICGDCSYYSDCKIKDKFNCKYSLNYKEVKDRLKEWFNK